MKGSYKIAQDISRYYTLYLKKYEINNLLKFK